MIENSRIALHRLFALSLLVSATGCSMSKLAVSTQADVMQQASPVIEHQTDYEFARVAIPGTLMQVEGLLRVAPEDERLLLLGTRGFASYAYGFVEDEMERAELGGDLEQADAARARARGLYLKAKGLGMKLLAGAAEGLAEAAARDPDQLKRFVTAEFTDPEAAPALFWTGYAWGSAINVSRDDVALVADLSLARALVERSVELDEKYYNAAGHVFLGVADASRGESIGGNPERGRQHFERALALTGRRAMIVQLNFAQFYATQTQNRDLFVALLKEVLETPVPADSPLALPNTVARRRAERLMAQVDTLFLPPPEDAAPAAPEEPAGAPTPPAGEPAPGDSTPVVPEGPEPKQPPPAKSPPVKPPPAKAPAAAGQG